MPLSWLKRGYTWPSPLQKTWYFKTFRCSNNPMGQKGWEAVMAAAEGCTALETLEPLGTAWRKLVCGELLELDLRGNGNSGLAAACATLYLARSGSCLTRSTWGEGMPIYQSLAATNSKSALGTIELCWPVQWFKKCQKAQQRREWGVCLGFLTLLGQSNDRNSSPFYKFFKTGNGVIFSWNLYMCLGLLNDKREA